MGDSPSPPGKASRHRLLLVLGLGAVLIAGVVVGVAVAFNNSDRPDYIGSPPPARLIAPSFSLPDENGTTVTGDEFRGRVVLLSFLSTNCRAQCPPTASTIRVAMESLTPEERAEVSAIAISIDPDFDSAEAAVAFLDERRLTGVMSYLVGSVADLEPVWKDYAVLSSIDTGSSDNHSVPVRIFDRDGVWVASLRNGDDLSAENLVHDVREALDS